MLSENNVTHWFEVINEINDKFKSDSSGLEQTLCDESLVKQFYKILKINNQDKINV